MRMVCVCVCVCVRIQQKSSHDSSKYYISLLDFHAKHLKSSCTLLNTKTKIMPIFIYILHNMYFFKQCYLIYRQLQTKRLLQRKCCSSVLEATTLLCPQCKSILPNIFVSGWLKENNANLLSCQFALSTDSWVCGDRSKSQHMTHGQKRSDALKRHAQI